MKKMNYMDTYNAVTGGIIAFLSLVFGEHWLLFAMFLLFNIVDWLTGWMKSSIAHKTNSIKGWQGVLKKLGYWMMILVAFAASAVFIEIGNTIGIDLGITALLGYFVLASLLVNEIRSIIAVSYTHLVLRIFLVSTHLQGLCEILSERIWLPEWG